MYKTFYIYKPYIDRFKKQYPNCFSRFLTHCVDSSELFDNESFELFKKYYKKQELSKEIKKVCVTHYFSSSRTSLDLNYMLYMALSSSDYFDRIWSFRYVD